MTKSNFKYSSGAAGGTLFKPTEPDTSYRPFDKQAASQPILDAIRKNTEVAVGNVKRTGDRFLTTKRIEHGNEEFTAKYNAGIKDVNTQIALEKLKSFSKGAQQIGMFAADQYVKWQERKAHAVGVQLARKDPEVIKDFLNMRELFNKQKRTDAEEARLLGWKALVDDGDPGLANAILDARGYTKLVVAEATKGEIIQNLPQRFKDALDTKIKYTLNELGALIPGLSAYEAEKFYQAQEEGRFINDAQEDISDQPLSYQEVHDLLKLKFGKEPIQFIGAIDSIYRSKAEGMLHTELVDLGYTTEEIIQDFDPAINLVRNNAALNAHTKQTTELRNNLSDLKWGNVRDVFRMALGQGFGYVTKRMDEMVNNDWKGFPGATEAEQRAASRKNKLEIIIELLESNERSTNMIEIADFLTGSVTRGGGETSLRNAWRKELEELDFENRVLSIDFQKRGYAKETLENKKKAFYAAAAEIVEQTGRQMTTEDAKTYAKYGASKGYGTEDDLLLGLVQKMPTQLGGSIIAWTKEIKDNHRLAPSDLKRSDYVNKGVPEQVLNDPEISKLFAEKASSVITFETREGIEKDLREKFAKTYQKWNGVGVLPDGADYAGTNIYDRYFKSEFKDATVEFDRLNLSQPELIEKTKRRVWKILKDEDNRKGLLKEPTELERRNKNFKLRSKEIASSKTGRADQFVFSEYQPKAKWYNEVWLPQWRKSGGVGDPIESFSEDTMWPDPNEGGKLVYFITDAERDMAHHAQAGGVKNFMRLQQKAYGDPGLRHKIPLPGIANQLDKVLHQSPKWVTDGFEQLSSNINPTLFGQPMNKQNPETFFTEVLGLDSEKFEARLQEMGTTTSAYYGSFLKQLGVKKVDKLDANIIAQMYKVLYNYFGDEMWPEGSFTRQDNEISWSPPQWDQIYNYLKV